MQRAHPTEAIVLGVHHDGDLVRKSGDGEPADQTPSGSIASLLKGHALSLSLVVVVVVVVVMSFC